MKPLVRGHETDLVEIPANWYLDDLPPMMFIKKAPNSHGFVNPRDIEEMWRDQFDWVYREHDYAVFPMTIHPDVSGRPQVLMMLERLYRPHQPSSRRELRDHGRNRRRFRSSATRAPSPNGLSLRSGKGEAMCGLCGILGGEAHWTDDRRPRARAVAPTASTAPVSPPPASRSSA